MWCTCGKGDSLFSSKSPSSLTTVPALLSLLYVLFTDYILLIRLGIKWRTRWPTWCSWFSQGVFANKSETTSHVTNLFLTCDHQMPPFDDEHHSWLLFWFKKVHALYESLLEEMSRLSKERNSRRVCEFRCNYCTVRKSLLSVIATPQWWTVVMIYTLQLQPRTMVCELWTIFRLPLINDELAMMIVEKLGYYAADYEDKKFDRS